MNDEEKLIEAMCAAYDKARRASDPQGYIEFDAVDEDAMRAARRAIDASGTHWVAPASVTRTMLREARARLSSQEQWVIWRDACLAERERDDDL